MNPLSLRIKVDRRRRGSTLPDPEDFDLQSAFSILYANRGRSLQGACEDAKDRYFENFLRQVEQLAEIGYVSIQGKVLFLHHRKPRGPLEQLARVAE